MREGAEVSNGAKGKKKQVSFTSIGAPSNNSICGGRNNHRMYTLLNHSRMQRKERPWPGTRRRRRPHWQPHYFSGPGGNICLQRPSARTKLLSHDTKLGCTKALRRSLKDERSITGDGTHVPHSRSYQPIVASVSLDSSKISRETESIFVVSGMFVTPRMLPGNAV